MDALKSQRFKVWPLPCRMVALGRRAGLDHRPTQNSCELPAVRAGRSRR